MMLKSQIQSCQCTILQKIVQIIPETTGDYGFIEATDVNADISNDNNFKSFKYKAKLLQDTETVNSNGILKNATAAVPLKDLSNFWRSLEMPLINCKVELKRK